MTKLIKCLWKDDYNIFLEFSDGTNGYFDLGNYISTRQGTLLEPLHDPAFARRCFIDAGALCWPHGLELSPAKLHSDYLVKQVA